MTKRVLFLVTALTVLAVTPSHAFLDYLFSGSASRDAIDNSAVGDLRAWWSGNPVYTFNPYYSGPASTGQPQQQQGQQQQVMQQQPSVNFYPGGQAGAYGDQQQYPAPQYGGYGTAPQQQQGTYGYQGYAPGGAYQQQTAQPQYQQPTQYPTQPQAQPVYQVPQQQQYAPYGQAPQGAYQ